MSCEQSHSVAAQLLVVLLNSETIISTNNAAVTLSLFNLTPCPLVYVPPGRTVSLPLSPIHIAACLIYVRPSLLWCRPSMNAVPFRPAARRSTSRILIAILLLLSGDIELNPGPCHRLSSTVNIGTFNICSAANNVGSIHSILRPRSRCVSTV